MFEPMNTKNAQVVILVRFAVRYALCVSLLFAVYTVTLSTSIVLRYASMFIRVPRGPSVSTSILHATLLPSYILIYAYSVAVVMFSRRDLSPVTRTARRAMLRV